MSPTKCKVPAVNPLDPLVKESSLPLALVRKYKNETSRPLVKKNVSTLNAPFAIVWNRNSFWTTFRYSILSVKDIRTMELLLLLIYIVH